MDGRALDSEFYAIIAWSYTHDELKRLYAQSFTIPGSGEWMRQVVKAREDFRRGLSA